MCVEQIFVNYAVFSLRYLLSLHLSISVYCLTLLYEMRFKHHISGKVSHFYSLNNLKWTNLNNFGIQNSKKISHHKHSKNYNLSTSPAKCNYCTFGILQKVIFAWNQNDSIIKRYYMVVCVQLHGTVRNFNWISLSNGCIIVLQNFVKYHQFITKLLHFNQNRLTFETLAEMPTQHGG